MIVSCLSTLLWARQISITARERGGDSAATLPKQCRPGKTSTGALGWRWKSNTHVRLYYLKSNFSSTEAEAISRAVNNWNNALREIDSRIVFISGGERENVVEDDASITVMRGIPKGKERLGEIKFYSMSNGVNRMVVTISPVVTDLNALTSLMAHEIGHSLGLADCYGCRRGTTTMAAFKDDNKGNDVYEPSECDKYVVAAGYGSEASVQARIVRIEQK
jgi:predicted Zn-dependent protease